MRRVPHNRRRIPSWTQCSQDHFENNTSTSLPFVRQILCRGALLQRRKNEDFGRRLLQKSSSTWNLATGEGRWVGHDPEQNKSHNAPFYSVSKQVVLVATLQNILLHASALA